MIKERQTSAAASTTSRQLARAGFDRPVEHLHFDRRARVWWSHDDVHAQARPLAVLTASDGVSE